MNRHTVLVETFGNDPHAVAEAANQETWTFRAMDLPEKSASGYALAIDAETVSFREDAIATGQAEPADQTALTSVVVNPGYYVSRNPFGPIASRAYYLGRDVYDPNGLVAPMLPTMFKKHTSYQGSSTPSLAFDLDVDDKGPFVVNLREELFETSNTSDEAIRNGELDDDVESRYAMIEQGVTALVTKGMDYKNDIFVPFSKGLKSSERDSPNPQFALGLVNEMASLGISRFCLEQRLPFVSTEGQRHAMRFNPEPEVSSEGAYPYSEWTRPLQTTAGLALSTNLTAYLRGQKMPYDEDFLASVADRHNSTYLDTTQRRIFVGSVRELGLSTEDHPSSDATLEQGELIRADAEFGQKLKDGIVHVLRRMKLHEIDGYIAYEMVSFLEETDEIVSIQIDVSQEAQALSDRQIHRYSRILKKALLQAGEHTDTDDDLVVSRIKLPTARSQESEYDYSPEVAKLLLRSDGGVGVYVKYALEAYGWQAIYVSESDEETERYTVTLTDGQSSEQKLSVSKPTDAQGSLQFALHMKILAFLHDTE